MDIEQLRAELTRRGISFAPNAGIANLEGKLAEAIAKEAEETGGQPGAPNTDPTPTPEVPPGKSGKVKDAAPAADPVTAPAATETHEAEATELARFEAMVDAKVAAGLSREMATEVVKRQLAYDATLKPSEG